MRGRIVSKHESVYLLTQGCIRYLQISSTAHGGDPLPVGKYNCATLFLGQMSSLFF